MESKTENEQFIQRINRKEAVAFHCLFEQFYRPLVHFSLRYIHKQEVAEDLIQDLFIRLWESNTPFRTYNEFRTMLYTSARNAAINWIKHKEVEEKYISYSLINTEPQESLDFDIMRDELYRLLFQYVEELPRRRREVFKLYLQGKKNEEIASLLGISAETVKTAKKESVRYLRERSGHLFFWFIILKIF